MQFKFVAVSLLSVILYSAPLAGGSSQAWAQDSQDDGSPSELAREGLERMLRALNLFIEMIPQYELPEVLENGDIIIRRKHNPNGDDDETVEPEVEKTGA